MPGATLFHGLVLQFLTIAILASESRYLGPQTEDELRLTEVLREIKELENDKEGTQEYREPEIRQEIREAVDLLRKELEKQQNAIRNIENDHSQQTQRNSEDSFIDTKESLTDSSNLEEDPSLGGISDNSIGAGDSNSLQNNINNCDNNGRCTASSPTPSNSQPIKNEAAPEAQPVVRLVSGEESDDTVQLSVAEDSADAGVVSSGLFLAIVAGCSVAGLIGLIVAGVCWYKLQKNVKATSEVEYPAYGHSGGGGQKEGGVGSPGDRKLAQSAQMYHYQHQKQQMIAMEKANGEMKPDGSEDDTEDENEEGDYTVYECPGLAPTGEMEVKNPLFNDETPVAAGPDEGTSDAPQ